MIYTFYSYKGGVGRSMALANVAELLFQAGLHVGVVDWDLEAPGLERYFPVNLDDVLDRPGLMDLILRYKHLMTRDLPPPADDQPTLPFETPDHLLVDLYPPLSKAQAGRLWLLPAGRRSKTHFAEYARTVGTFDWHDFYENWEGEIYIEWLRQQMERLADVVLIDSRTGVTEIGGITTYQLADVVVMFCAPNQQSLDGTYEMATNFTQPEVRDLRRGRPLDVLIVPARVEDRSETQLLHEFRRQFLERFGPFIPADLNGDRESIWRLKIPYVPYYAFNEVVAVREQGIGNADDMAEAFAELTQAMACLVRPSSERRIDVLRAVEQLVQQAIQRRQITPASPPVDLVPPCPYPGMVPFQAANAQFFYGRDDQIQHMLHQLRYHRFLLVVGPSGCGKSSLVFAGLIPRIMQRTPLLPGPWYVHIMRPGAQPTQALAAVLGGDMAQPEQAVAALFATHGSAQRLLLVVDQFEELFLQADRAEQQRFAATLASLRTLEACAVILTMRADFYPDLMTSDLWPVGEGERAEITPLGGSALRAAIQQPAADVGVQFEPALVERLLADATDQPGSLPLLQETLGLLWSHMDGRTLTLLAYEQLGAAERSGLAVALALRADSTLGALDPAQQALARRIFLRLIQFGEGRPHTRRQQSVAALRAVGDDPSRFDATLAALTDSRLLTLSGEASGDDKRVDLSHEALITGWPTLQLWVSERREAEQARRRLEAKAAEWVRLGRGQGGLLDDVAWHEAERWLASPDAADLGYDDELLALVRASQAALERAKQAQKMRLQSRVAALAGALVLLCGISIYALAAKAQADTSSRHAEELGRLATSRQLAVQARDQFDSQFTLALLLATQANRLSNTIESRDALADGLGHDLRLSTLLADNTVPAGRTPTVSSVAFSPDGKRLATGRDDGTIRLWDVTRQQPLGSPLIANHQAAVLSVAFSPDGATLASGNADGAVRLWSVTREAPLGPPLNGHTRAVSTVAFSPDGKALASGGADSTIRLWDTAHWQLRRLFNNGPGQVSSVAFSPDGTTLASGDASGAIRLWDVAHGRALGPPLNGHTRAVSSVAFSPDGTTLASGSADSTIRLWDVARQQPRGLPLAGDTHAVYSVAFSPDGATLASGGADGTVRLWNVAHEQLLGPTLTGHTGAVYGVAFSPDGKILASGSADRTVRLWNPARRRSMGKLPAWLGIASSVAFGHDGKVLAAGSWDGAIRLWDVTRRQPLGPPLSGHTAMVLSVAFSPDGKTLASGGADTTVRLWDVARQRPLGLPLTGHTGAVNSVAFSPDGATLASGSADSTIRLWDLARGQSATLAGDTNSILDVAFSPDGTTLASGSADSTIHLWDIDPQSWQRQACRIANRNLSRLEWQRYVGGYPYQTTCPHLPSAAG